MSKRFLVAVALTMTMTAFAVLALHYGSRNAQAFNTVPAKSAVDEIYSEPVVAENGFSVEVLVDGRDQQTHTEQIKSAPHDHLVVGRVGDGQHTADDVVGERRRLGLGRARCSDCRGDPADGVEHLGTHVRGQVVGHGRLRYG